MLTLLTFLALKKFRGRLRYLGSSAVELVEWNTRDLTSSDIFNCNISKSDHIISGCPDCTISSKIATIPVVPTPTSLVLIIPGARASMSHSAILVSSMGTLLCFGWRRVSPLDPPEPDEGSGTHRSKITFGEIWSLRYAVGQAEEEGWARLRRNGLPVKADQQAPADFYEQLTIQKILARHPETSLNQLRS